MAIYVTLEGKIPRTPLCERFTKGYVTQQFERLLKKNNGYLILSDGTSHPNFQEFLDCINTSKIGGVNIEKETTVNRNVKATLSCSLFFSEGIVKIEAHWCAHKEARASEVVTSLLCPLHRENLEAITFLKISHDDDHKYKKLVHGDDYTREIKDIFELSGSPYYSISTEEPDNELQEYINLLRESDNQGMVNKFN